jgi:hypothetical protein
LKNHSRKGSLGQEWGRSSREARIGMVKKGYGLLNSPFRGYARVVLPQLRKLPTAKVTQAVDWPLFGVV